MDAKSFAQVILRLLAVFLIFLGLASLPTVIRELFFTNSVPPDTKVDVPLFIASFALTPVVGIVLWLVSPTLGRWMATPSATAEATVPLDTLRIQAVAFVILGTWLAVRSISEVLVFMASSEIAGDPYFWQHVVEVALSIFLIAGAKSLARLAVKLREFGLK
jgi:hypothetical protein